MVIELKPCPFCAGEAKLMDNEFGEPVFDNNMAQVDFMYSAPDTFWVECTECGATGCATSTEEKAAESWNTREEEPAAAYNLSPTESWWIPATEKMPEEHESIFARFYGTKNWMPGMFCTVSDTVIAAVLYEDGKRTVKAMHTQDGKWHHPGMVGIKEVTHWMPMPLPPADLRR